jgi:hypothetical protein
VSLVRETSPELCHRKNLAVADGELVQKLEGHSPDSVLSGVSVHKADLALSLGP